MYIYFFLDQKRFSPRRAKSSLSKSKQFTKKAQQKLIYSECFIFSFYLPKQCRRAINPHPGNQKKERNKKRLQKNTNKKTSK